MRKYLSTELYGISFCVVLLATPAWADVEVSERYGTWGNVSNKKITAEGLGVGDERVKGTEAFQQIGEAAALVGAVRSMGELISTLQSDLQKLEKEKRTDAILQLYAGLPTLFPANTSPLSLIPPPGLDSSILGSSIFRVGPAEVLGTTVVRNYLATEDTIRLYIGTQELRVENFATSKAEALPALMALLNEQGFTWTFKSNRDGSVECRLVYPLAELKRRLAERASP